MELRWVVDTNVLVSGPMNANGPPGRILDAVLHGDVRPVVDDRVLHEYAEVLTRSRLRLDASAVAQVLAYVSAACEHHVVPVRALPFEMPRTSDAPLAEVALYAGADALVTGNLRHFRGMRDHGAVSVLTPAEAVARLMAG